MGLFNFWKPKTITYTIDTEINCPDTLLGQLLTQKRERTGFQDTTTAALFKYCSEDVKLSQKMYCKSRYQVPETLLVTTEKGGILRIRMSESSSPPIFVKVANWGKIFNDLSLTYSFSHTVFYPSNTVEGGSGGEWTSLKIHPILHVDMVEAIKAICLQRGFRVLSSTEFKQAHSPTDSSKPYKAKENV